MYTCVPATQDGTTYNVGTELNDFVYGTLATWYNEDVQAPNAQLEVPQDFNGKCGRRTYVRRYANDTCYNMK